MSRLLFIGRGYRKAKRLGPGGFAEPHHSPPDLFRIFSLALGDATRGGLTLRLRQEFGSWPIWGQSSGKGRSGPQQPTDPNPASLVVGEVHHPFEPRKIGNPNWRTILEIGLSTGVFFFGTVGPEKASACMYRFFERLLRWQAHDQSRRAVALVWSHLFLSLPFYFVECHFRRGPGPVAV